MILKNSGFDKNSTYFEHSLDSSVIPTVFIHGVGLDHTMWLPQKKHFLLTFSPNDFVQKQFHFGMHSSII